MRRATEFLGTSVSRAIFGLKKLTDLASVSHGKGMLQLWPPGKRPVDHQRHPCFARRSQHLVSAVEIRGHRFFYHDMQPSFGGHHRQFRATQVIGKDIDRIEIDGRQHLVIIIKDLRAIVLTFNFLTKFFTRISRRDQDA